MIKHLNLLILPPLLICCGAASAQPGQYPVMDKVVEKVLQKYQTSSCQQLANEKSQPPSGKKGTDDGPGGAVVAQRSSDAR
ncbi:MAG: hypothetical protein ACHBNF_13065 [Chromatiales bacterium]